jgi:type IV pilus assembly protein PilC
VMAVATTIFLLTFVLPRFITLFRGKEAILPKPTKILIGLSTFIRHFWYLLIAAAVGLGAGFYYAIGHPKGREAWDKAKLHIPLLKRMLRALYITRSLHTMGELITAGVPMLDVLAITGEVSGHSMYKRMWMAVHRSVKQGEKIAATLFNQPRLLPGSVLQMIAAGEESGKLGDVLREVSDFYAKELRSTIKSVTSMIEPLMIMIMGLIVGFIAMSIILPIFKMSSLVKG